MNDLSMPSSAWALVLMALVLGCGDEPRSNSRGNAGSGATVVPGTDDGPHPRCAALCSQSDGLCVGAEQSCLEDCEGHTAGVSEACATCLLQQAEGWCTDIDGEPLSPPNCTCIDHLENVRTFTECSSVCD
jgi:hypothetical protein